MLFLFPEQLTLPDRDMCCLPGRPYALILNLNKILLNSATINYIHAHYLMTGDDELNLR